MWTGRVGFTALLSGVRRSDIALAAALLALGMADALSAEGYAGGNVRLAVAAALQTAPVLLRRTHPATAVGVSLVGVLVEVAGVQAYGGVYGLVTFLVLVHATSRWAEGGQRRAAAAFLVAGAVAHVLSQNREGPLGLLGSVVVVAGLAAAAWGAGRIGLRAQHHEHELEQRRAELIEAERARISRELHDVVGHALAGISLTAGAAAQRSREDPVAADALDLIHTMSRDAASDVRRLVGLLREEADSADSREPRPTLDALPLLVDRARAAGMDVELHAAGESDDVPPGVQLAAYRVVQEGLTNAAKHAAGAPVTVRVQRAAGRLEISVEDVGGDDASGAEAGPGHGLIGLAERVRLYDGRLDACPHDAGFRLRAVLPLPGSAR